MNGGRKEGYKSPSHALTNDLSGVEELVIEPVGGKKTQVMVQEVNGYASQLIGRLRGMDDTVSVEEMLLSEVHTHSNIKRFSLSRVGVAIVALGISLATGGTASALAGNLTTAMGMTGAAATAVTGAATGGMMSLAQTAGVSLINHEMNFARAMGAATIGSAKADGIIGAEMVATAYQASHIERINNTEPTLMGALLATATVVSTGELILEFTLIYQNEGIEGVERKLAEEGLMRMGSRIVLKRLDWAVAEVKGVLYHITPQKVQMITRETLQHIQATETFKKLRQNVYGGHQPAYAGQVGGVAEDAASTAAKISYSRKHGGGERGGGSGGGKPSQPSNERGKGDLANYKGELFSNNPDKFGREFKDITGTRAQINQKDGTVWESCTGRHGGPQWKMWRSKRSWESGREEPMSVWPDGRVRKYGDQ